MLCSDSPTIGRRADDPGDAAGRIIRPFVSSACGETGPSPIPHRSPANRYGTAPRRLDPRRADSIPTGEGSQVRSGPHLHRSRVHSRCRREKSGHGSRYTPALMNVSRIAFTTRASGDKPSCPNANPLVPPDLTSVGGRVVVPQPPRRTVVGLGRDVPPATLEHQPCEQRRRVRRDRQGMLRRADEPEPIRLARGDQAPGDGLAEQVDQPAGVLEILDPDVGELRGDGIGPAAGRLFLPRAFD